MSDWRDKKPGLERANAVMKPWPNPYPAPRVFVAAFNLGRDGVRFPGNLPCPICEAVPRRFFSERNQLRYPDQYPASRIISADRAERAVETQTFLEICEEEELWLGFSDGRWQVLTGDSDLDGPESKTLRGAYVSYHLKKGDTDGTSNTDTE